MRMTYAWLLAALLVNGAFAATLMVDNRIPQGNIFVAGINGDTVELHNEIRDTDGWWFWWAFRVRGAEGRTLKFKFRPDPLTGWNEYVSLRGAAVSADLGATWDYTEKESFTKDEFTYTFAKDAKEVWFAMCIPHGLREWNAFVARHVGDAEHFRVGTLCQTKKGRPVPFVRVGRLDGKAPLRVVATARHHAAENVASFVQEGIVDELLADTDTGRWFRENVEALVVPFIDLDGVVDGDQGKNRSPHDHARDYGNWIYPSTAALRDWMQKEWKGRIDVALDIHCPHYNNPLMHQIMIAPGKNEVRQHRMAQIVYEKQRGIVYHPKNDVAWNTPWNCAGYMRAGQSFAQWVESNFETRLVTLYEIPFASASEKSRGPFSLVTADTAREFGRGFADALCQFLKEPDPVLKTPTVKCLGKFETGDKALSVGADWSVDKVRFDRDAWGNPYTFFDGDVHQVDKGETTISGRRIAYVKYERESNPIVVVRQTGKLVLANMEIDLSSLMPERKDYVYVDLASGKIYTLPSIRRTPVGADPGLVLPASQAPRQVVWRKMSPAEIVDSWYRPYEPRAGVKMPLENERWTKMKTADFLPCIDRYGQFKYREWPGKTHSDEELRSAAAEEAKDLAANPGPADWNAFGGWTGGPQLKATGRFRTEKVDGKWWLVDPEGRLFWSWGAVRVTPSSAMTPLNGNPRTPRTGSDLPDRDCLFEDLPKPGDEYAQFYETFDDLLKPFYLKRGETRWYDFSASNLRRKYGKDWFAKYSDICHRRLRSWGANTIANSSDIRICLQDRTPYAERVECLSRPIEGSWGQWFKFRDPFDPSFKAACLSELAKHGREAHDKWCIGFFIDNEIQWGAKDTDLAQWTLWSPDDQPAKVEFLKRLAAKGIDPKKVPDEELRGFTAVLVEEYFRRTREAVKEFDVDLLYLGCRFAGSARPWVIGPCAKYADVVSYNIYSDRLDGWRLPQGLDAPVLIGEFHFGAWDRGLFGCSLKNKGSQSGRAAALKGYVESALCNPQVVGVHWHQFSDQATTGRFDGEHFQVGWTDVCDRPYRETVDALRSIDIYGSRSK